MLYHLVIVLWLCKKVSLLLVLGNILVKCYRLGNVVKGIGELFTSTYKYSNFEISLK